METVFWFDCDADELEALFKRQVPGSVRAKVWELLTKHYTDQFQQAIHLKSKDPAYAPMRKGHVA